MTAPRHAIHRIHPRWWVLVVLAIAVAALVVVVIVQIAT